VGKKETKYKGAKTCEHAGVSVFSVENDQLFEKRSKEGYVSLAMKLDLSWKKYLKGNSINAVRDVEAK
jgi:hypothetical protein